MINSISVVINTSNLTYSRLLSWAIFKETYSINSIISIVIAHNKLLKLSLEKDELFHCCHEDELANVLEQVATCLSW